MDSLKVCFIGVGSIARRHIKNLQAVCDERKIDLQVDALRRNWSLTEGVTSVYTEIEALPCDYDAIFITNPTALHLITLQQVQEKGRHFFIEKPVVSVEQIELARQFDTRKDTIYYVACPLRYNAVVQYIKKNIDPTDVISVRSISSSYLPEWRPGQDYRKSYSAHKDMGGGVSIDLIHEWDYLTYLFGYPKKVFTLMGKKSSLEIDSDDYAVYIAEYADKVLELHLDYFGRKSIREIQLITKDDTIVGDIVNNQLRFLKINSLIDFKEERDDYQKREINHFLDMIFKKLDSEDGYHHGIKVLGLTQGEL